MLKNNKKIVLVFFIFIIILSIMQFIVPQVIGYDGYLHIKIAEIIKQGGFIKEFPWAKHTILANNYADIQILFRVLLIPFTFFGLSLGAKIASIFFGAVCFTIFYWFLIENKIKYALFWTMLYLFTAENLMYRFLLTRHMPITIALLILTIYFLQKKKYFLLSISSFVFVLFYSGFVIQLFIIFLYFVLGMICQKPPTRDMWHERLTPLHPPRPSWWFLSMLRNFQRKFLTFSRKFDYKIILYSLGGIVLGLIINPYFPNNIFMLYTQIFKVNLIANLYNVEWRAWPFFEFIKNNILVLFYFILTFFLLIKNRKLTKNRVFYLLVALFFFAYTLKSRRIQEYLVPFSILMLALFLNEYIKKIDKTKFFNYCKIFAIIFLIVVGIGNYMLLRKDVINNNFLYHYDNCVNWINNNIPKNSLIFINAYAFPYLFFKNSDLRYTHGIDLTYSYLYNAEEFERYMGILRGAIKDKDDFIVKDYRPDYLFVGKVEQDVKLYEYIIKHKENYKVEYEDDWCGVLRVK